MHTAYSARNPRLPKVLILNDAPRSYVSKTGIPNPGAILFDAAFPNRDNIILYNYFNDLYKLLMSKLTKFAVEDVVGVEDKTRLTALLTELIKVKGLLVQDQASK